MQWGDLHLLFLSPPLIPSTLVQSNSWRHHHDRICVPVSSKRSTCICRLEWWLLVVDCYSIRVHCEDCLVIATLRWMGSWCALCFEILRRTLKQRAPVH